MIFKLASHAIRPSVLILTLLACLLGLYFLENEWRHMPFVSMILLAIAAITFLITRRIGFSLYLAMGIVGGISVASIAKYRGKGFDLHIYDVAFTGTDPEAMLFLVGEYAIFIVPIFILLIIGLSVLAVLWRMERPSQADLLSRASPLLAALVLVPTTYPLDASEPRYFHYLSGYNASSFFISFLDLNSDFSETVALAKLQMETPAEAYPSTNACDGMEMLPDIYIVLSESATNFRNIPQLNLQNFPADAFTSEDGTMRTLRVETFGGGTWVSNLSLMTGLSSNDFGWRAPYLTTQMEGRIHESLALSLRRCGYRTASMTPMKYSFVNEGPFLESIGFDTVLDYNAIGAYAYAHRDEFYYDAADRFIEAHQREDGRPLFFEIQTMFGHSPFDETRLPELQFQKEPFADDPQMDEHVRRVFIAQNDFRAFLRKRKELQPERPFVLLEFGDHHALINKRYTDEVVGGNSLLAPNSIAYQTHYTLHTHRADLDRLPFQMEPMDISYLGVSLLEAVGVPLSPMFTELARLRDHCHGRFHDCADRKAVDDHIRRRLSSGLLNLP